MRKTLKPAVALVVLAAAFAAVAAGGTNPAKQSYSSKQRIRIEAKGSGRDPFHAFVIAISRGWIPSEEANMTFCCWSETHVVRAGSSLLVTNPRITITSHSGNLKIRERIEWIDIPDGFSIQTGTWKVIAGSGAYAGLSGHGRVASVLGTNGYLRIRLFGLVTKAG